MELSIRITEEDFVKDKELFTKLKGLLNTKDSNDTVSGGMPNQHRLQVLYSRLLPPHRLRRQYPHP